MVGSAVTRILIIILAAGPYVVRRALKALPGDFTIPEDPDRIKIPENPDDSRGSRPLHDSLKALPGDSRQ